MTNLIPKTMLSDKEAMDKILAGAKKAYDAVTATMGPNGNLVGYNSMNAVFDTYTKDGVSVAKQITLKDPAENMGALLLIQAALKQVEESGDGTTLTVLLAYEMIKNGVKAIKKGTNPTKLRDGIDLAVNDLIESIQHDAVKEISNVQMEHVATVAVNGDRELGQLIADAVVKTGKHGIVTRDKSSSTKNYVEYAKGYQIDTGIKFQEFVNNTEKHNHDTEDALIVVTDYPLCYGPDIHPIAELVENTPTILIAEEVRDEALQAIIHSKKNGYNMTVIETKALPMEQEYILRDIAALTGATFISRKTGTSIKSMTMDDIGKCDRVISSPKKTIFYNDNPMGTIERTDNLMGRTAEIKEAHDTSDNMELAIIEKSIAKLSGGIAVVRVAANSESEQLEILDRVDDAIRACQSAREEGITEGGGVALFNAAHDLSDYQMKVLRSHDKDAYKGAIIVREAAVQPIVKILSNADIKPDRILAEIADPESKCNAYSLRARKAITANMSDMGVVDPVKVIRTALLNSASVAKVILQTKVLLIEDLPEIK